MNKMIDWDTLLADVQGDASNIANHFRTRSEFDRATLERRFVIPLTEGSLTVREGGVSELDLWTSATQNAGSRLRYAVRDHLGVDLHSTNYLGAGTLETLGGEAIALAHIPRNRMFIFNERSELVLLPMHSQWEGGELVNPDPWPLMRPHTRKRKVARAKFKELLELEPMFHQLALDRWGVLDHLYQFQTDTEDFRQRLLDKPAVDIFQDATAVLAGERHNIRDIDHRLMRQITNSTVMNKVLAVTETHLHNTIKERT